MFFASEQPRKIAFISFFGNPAKWYATALFTCKKIRLSWSQRMPRMKILNSIEQEAFELPPVLNSAERKRYFDFPAGV